MHLQHLFIIMLPTIATAIALPQSGGIHAGGACGEVALTGYCHANCVHGRCVASGTTLNSGLSICVCR